LWFIGIHAASVFYGCVMTAKFAPTMGEQPNCTLYALTYVPALIGFGLLGLAAWVYNENR